MAQTRHCVVAVCVAATLLAADKLNLEVARLLLEEERLRIAKPPMATGGGGLTVIIEAPRERAKTE